MKFSELSLTDGLLKNLSDAGYETPTPIQSQAIPVLLEGNDLLAVAQTGTGKTAAFALPIIQKLAEHSQKSIPGHPRALILVPTRELALQITENLETYGKNLIKSTAIFGGVGQSEQVKALKSGIDIVVATPGRLLDLVDQRQLKLSRIEFFVMDEADRMLDMGFMEDIEKILKLLPSKRQSMFFSATMSPLVVRLSKSILNNSKRVEIAPQGTSADNIDQKVIYCQKVDKFQLLRKILKDESPELVIVFTKTKDSADKVKEYLFSRKISSLVIHGDKNQNDRERALNLFKNADIKIMIATDIAARGLDIQNVSHVINFELPVEAESYVHRIGRTARAGKEGKAITFCDDAEKGIIERIQKLIKRIIPSETYRGTPEPAGIWSSAGPMKKIVKAPTPGKSQEKTAYLDHSKRQRVVKEGEPRPVHPAFRGKKKRK